MICSIALMKKPMLLILPEKGRSILAPNNPEAFVIPDLGEILHDIDTNDSLSKTEKDKEKDSAHQTHADRSGKNSQHEPAS